MRTTTLDFAILGLLLSQPMTAYAIRMVFDATAIGNFSSSPGTIYPATHKLKKMGLVTQKHNGGGPLEITEEGKSQMKLWLTQSISIEDIAKRSHILILKFAFMDYLVSQKDKESFLEAFVLRTKEYLQTLEDYHRSEAAQLPLHGRLSFEYGIASMKAQLSWAKSALKKI